MTYPDFLALAGLEANKTTLTSADKQILTHWINRGLREHWDMVPGKRIWPWLQDTSSETLSSYKVALTALNSSQHVTLWEADPRPLWSADTFENAVALPWTRDDTHLRVQASSATATVVAFYSVACPSFNYVTDAASVLDLIPTEMVDWLLANVFRRNLRQNFTSADQRLLERADQRLAEEFNRMLYTAEPIWQDAIWLDYELTYQRLTRI